MYFHKYNAQLVAIRKYLLSFFLWLALLTGFVCSAQGAAEIALLDDNGVPASNAKQQRTLKIINYLIEKAHYRSVELDDAFSEKVLDEYLTQLDPGRSFFLAADIEQFYRLRHQFDDYIRHGSLKPAFAIFSIFRTRADQRVEYALERLRQPFDFGIHEDHVLDREDLPWAADAAELDEIWRKRIKNEILGLRLTGKDRDEILETLGSRYTHIARRTRQFKSDDIFQTFTNAYVNSIEPHTSYFSPRATENFKINMRLSLEGIGAVLQTDNEYTRVRRVVPGGPADLGGELQAEDRIVGVGQGDEDIVDVIGWRLDDVVGLIRGPKNSTVRLEILPGNSGLHGETEIISIVRDEIRLEEQAAKKQVLEVDLGDDPTRIGLIQLPSFYADFDAMRKGDQDYRSTTRDVRRLLEEFRGDDIDGLVIDLRGNGGGALSEAISLTGLFIRQGPVVQVENSGGKVQIDRDPDPEIVYKGPLAVLVDGYSASASEIFAGAIQDYRRGIVIGEPTFGKGTVQNLINLNRFSNNKDDLGQLKVTIAQFFRVNGDSTQYRGITPDLMWTTAGTEFGERAYENAIPWRHIREAIYVPFGESNAGSEMVLNMLRERHLQRIGNDPEFNFHHEMTRINREQRDITTVTLHEETRRSEREHLDEQRLRLKNRQRSAQGKIPFADIDALERYDLAELDRPESEQRTDFFVKESARILSDYIHLSRLYQNADRNSLVKKLDIRLKN